MSNSKYANASFKIRKNDLNETVVDSVIELFVDFETTKVSLNLILTFMDI